MRAQASRWSGSRSPRRPRRFPSLAGDDLEFVLHEHEAGAIRAQRAVRALVRPAGAEGARVRRDRAVPSGAGVQLADGTRLEAGGVVWACGGWLRDLFPGLVTLRVTRQELLFFDGGPAWADPGVPCWVDYDAAAYGTSDLDDLGVKAAPDVEGPPLDPDAELPPVSAEGEAAARAYVRRRFPSLADAPLKGAKTCRYELSPDSNFIVAPHPARRACGSSAAARATASSTVPRSRSGSRPRGTGHALPDAFALGERRPALPAHRGLELVDAAPAGDDRDRLAQRRRVDPRVGRV